MRDSSVEDAVSFFELKWDTDFFGINCAKAILNKPLTLDEWNHLKNKLHSYHFVSIINRNSEPINAQLIGKYSTAFLADVNIQFKKTLGEPFQYLSDVEIKQSLERNEQIIEMAEFSFSKFIEDPELAKRGGNQVYRQWVINSFRKPDKHFAILRNEYGDIIGFLLYSYKDKACVIELIAVSKTSAKRGAGTSLFKAVEHSAYTYGCKEIHVGTQIRNLEAINFYHKVGCKQVGCHQVYHWWNQHIE